MEIITKLWILNLLFISTTSTEFNSSGHCMTYGRCEGEHGEVPCVYEGPPKPLEFEIIENNRTANDILRSLCPDFAHGENPAVCCSTEQVKDFHHQMQLVETMGFSRCPSCYMNLKNAICHFACSPYQSQYIRVNRTMDAGKDNGDLSVLEMVYYMSKRFAYELFNSCKGLQGLVPGTLVMDYNVCGEWGSKHCTPERWMEFMGSTPDDNGYSPYKIHYILTMFPTLEVKGETIFPMRGNTSKCSESPRPGYERCSCNDCEEACGVESQPPVLPAEAGSFLVHGRDGFAVLMGILFGIFASIITVIYWIHFRQSKREVCDSSTRAPHHVSAHNFEARGINLGSLEEVTPLRSRSLATDMMGKKPNSKLSGSALSLPTLQETGSKFEKALQSVFSAWAKFVSHHPIFVMIISLLVSVILSCGLFTNFNITTSPVDLWVSPSSPARQHMEYFNKHFGPFYRVEHLIITPTNEEPFSHVAEIQYEYRNYSWGPVFRKEFLLAVYDLQQAIENVVGRGPNGTEVGLKDICVSPLSPLNDECAVQSVFGFFQNNRKMLLNESQYLTHFQKCSLTPRDQRCFAKYGGPLDSMEVVLGGFSDSKYETAKALIITIPVMNYYDETKNADALIWEKEFLSFLKLYEHPLMKVAYKAERSIQDELERGSKSDVWTVAVSYILMLCYIAIALGEVNSLKTLLVDSKLTLGFIGVIIVLVSVVSSLGAFSFVGIPATLIIVEVIPFLVLAVGVDNIFILVQAFQRDKKGKTETLEDQMSRVIGEVAPSMMLSSISMSSCFFIGALTEMPAVKIFAMYAGVALLINFFLQMTCFLALFILDIRRQESNRLDACCCIRISKKPREHSMKEGVLYKACKSLYSPFLMKDGVRYVVVLIFVGWLFSSAAVIHKLDVGFNQELSMPEDSYMLHYFKGLNKYLSVGPPVYFVITDGYDYNNYHAQKKICSSRAFCDPDSVLMQLGWMAKLKNRTRIAFQPVGWLDSYFEFLNSPSCCFRFYSNNTFCPSQKGVVKGSGCHSCRTFNSSELKPKEFVQRADFFLQDIPWKECSKSGKAMFRSAVELVKGEEDTRIGATNFMTYHTLLKTSEDFTEALRWARKISKNLTLKIASQKPGVEVFPYSFVHVFYEQYLTMWPDTVKSLGLSLAAVFLATFLLLGLDIHSAAIVAVTILMIVIDLMGLMYWWDISLNAVSLVNLVVAIGISVEFCSHLTRAFVFSSKSSRLLRAQDALCRMGSSVLSGITLTDCGILVLAFAKTQIFQVFYFRMYLGIIAFGTLHSIIFLPVFLSLAGPPARKMRKAKPNVASENGLSSTDSSNGQKTANTIHSEI